MADSNDKPIQGVPFPDPTDRTLKQAEKGLECLRELLEARMDGTDKMLQMLQEAVNHRQEAIDKEVRHLRELQDQQFKGIQVQFGERDTRIDKTAELNQKAIDAALQAAEKAVGKQNEASAMSIGKSEAATTKQIDLQAALLQTETKALNSTMDDMKARLATIEGVAVRYATDKTEVKSDRRDSQGTMFGIIGALVGVGGIVLAVILAVVK